MRKPTLYVLLLPFAMQTAIPSAQVAPGALPAPQFTLTLSEGHRGMMPANQQVFVVKMTNISKEAMRRDACDSFGGMINLEVVYNGVPVEKTEAELKWRKQHETGPCIGSMIKEETKPGESRLDTLYYNTTEPGTYEFTAARETFPGRPEKSVTVRSNTITIVVPEPEPEADAPK
jgi:hypothetical protein